MKGDQVGIQMNKMPMDNAELGNSVDDHEKAHNLLAELKAKLERICEDLTLFANNLNQRPGDIRIGESKIVLKDQQHHERTLLCSELDMVNVVRVLDEYQQTAHRKKQLERKLVEVGKRYIVDGLQNRKPPPRDLFAQDR